MGESNVFIYLFLFIIILIGASVIGRFASWLGTIWVSMQAALAFMFLGELVLNNVPFEKCSRVDRDQEVSCTVTLHTNLILFPIK